MFKKVLLIPIIACGTLVLVGCDNSGSSKVTKTYEIADNFSNFQIDLGVSDFEIKVSEDESKKVVYEDTKHLTHSVEVKDDALVIKETDTRKWYDFEFNLNVSVKVYLPSAEYNALSFRGSTGNVNIPHDYSFNSASLKLSTGNINFSANVAEYTNIEVSTGHVKVSDVTTKGLTLKTSTGNINVTNVAVIEDIKCNVSTGNVSFTDVTGENLSIEGTTGNVTLTNTVINKHMELKTSTGNIKLVDSDAETLNIKTTTGDVKGTLLTDHHFIVKSDTGKVKYPEEAEGVICRIETNTGDVDIQIKH